MPLKREDRIVEGGKVPDLYCDSLLTYSQLLQMYCIELCYKPLLTFRLKEVLRELMIASFHFLNPCALATELPNLTYTALRRVYQPLLT